MDRMREGYIVGILLAGFFCMLGLVLDRLGRKEIDPGLREHILSASRLFWFMGSLLVLALILVFGKD